MVYSTATGRENMTVRVALLYVLIGVLITALIGSLMFNRTLDDDIKSLEEETANIDQTLSFLEPYRGEDLEEDKVEYLEYLVEIEGDDGRFTDDFEFKTRVMPHLYRYYVASELGFMTKEDAWWMAIRARNFVMNDRSNYGQSFLAVQAVIDQLSYEIQQEEEENKDNNESVSRRANTSPFFFFSSKKIKSYSTTIKFAEAGQMLSDTTISCSEL
jgi:hypothetical protein